MLKFQAVAIDNVSDSSALLGEVTFCIYINITDFHVKQTSLFINNNTVYHGEVKFLLSINHKV